MAVLGVQNVESEAYPGTPSLSHSGFSCNQSQEPRFDGLRVTALHAV